MKSAPRLLAINPNSSESVTNSIAETIRSTLATADVSVVGVTCAEGPPGIVTQDDYEDATARMANCAARSFDGEYQAAIIACFSDPGLQAARVNCAIPVIGLGEAGMLEALSVGKRVGVIAVADAAIPRHLEYWQKLGVGDRVAGERAVNLSVADSGDADKAFDRMKEAALHLKLEQSADVILLGCAGMSALRLSLQEAIGIPVIDPCEAAATTAMKLMKQAASARQGGDAL